MAVTGPVQSSITVRDSQTVGVTTDANVGPSLTMLLAIANGTGAGQANKVYHAIRTFGTPDDLDLAGGIATVLGTTITFTSVIVVYIENLSTANTITIGNEGTNPWAGLLSGTGTFNLRPATATGQSWAIFVAPDATGWAVVAGTGDKLRVAGTNGQTYRIVLIGRG